MKKIRLHTIFIALFVAGMLFSACSNNRESKTKRMAVVISTLNNPWFVVLGETAARRAQELGYETMIFDSQNNTAKEAEHFENIIASGFDAILFNPTDAEGSVSNVNRAKTTGIPTFCIDREVNSLDGPVTQIISDNFSGCVELGQFFVRELNKKGKYVELLGLVGDNNTWNRSRGFHSVVDDFPELEMVAQQSADFDRSKALEVMESILQAHSEITGVFCGNDAMAMGAYQALAASDKAKEVQVFGFDGATDVMNAIKDGKIAATAMQSPKLMARTAAETAHRYLEGDKEIPRKIPIAVEIVTEENIDEFGAYGNTD